MRSEIPANAEQIELAGETAWLSATTSGLTVAQGHWQVDLENFERDGRPWYMVDWRNYAPRAATFEGGLARNAPGHLERQAFLDCADTIVAALRRRDGPRVPPETNPPTSSS